MSTSTARGEVVKAIDELIDAKSVPDPVGQDIARCTLDQAFSDYEQAIKESIQDDQAN